MLQALLKGLFRGLLLLGVVGLGWWLYGKATGASGRSASDETVVVSAEQLSSAYEANAAQADTLYKGRRLDVVGTVRAIEIGPAIKLAGDTPFATVWARLPSAQSDAVARLGKDARVKLACRGGGVTQRMPLLYDCVILP